MHVGLPIHPGDEVPKVGRPSEKDQESDEEKFTKPVEIYEAW